jgi:murein L,D-transpeptidase YafK
MKALRAVVLLLAGAIAAPAHAQASFGEPVDEAAEAARLTRPVLEYYLHRAGLAWGAPVLLRVFKQESQLEVWAGDGTRFRKLRTYPICAWSGALGPKVRQGDAQAPEGFYSVGLGDLRVRSAYHLGFDLGYPNAYDRAHGRTGNYLLVHGRCVSAGCYAMGNDVIDQVYTLVEAALRHGQRRVEVHAFPFRFSTPPMADWQHAEWGGFWQELEPAYDALEKTGVPPTIRVVGGHYVVSTARRSIAGVSTAGVPPARMAPAQGG